MTAREFLIARGRFVRELSKDANAMSAAVFMKKYGIEVRECRTKLKRLRTLATEGHGADGEVRELVGLFTAVCLRNEQ